LWGKFLVFFGKNLAAAVACVVEDAITFSEAAGLLEEILAGEFAVELVEGREDFGDLLDGRGVGLVAGIQGAENFLELVAGGARREIGRVRAETALGEELRNFLEFGGRHRAASEFEADLDFVALVAENRVRAAGKRKVFEGDDGRECAEKIAECCGFGGGVGVGEGVGQGRNRAEFLAEGENAARCQRGLAAGELGDRRIEDFVGDEIGAGIREPRVELGADFLVGVLGRIF